MNKQILIGILLGLSACKGKHADNYNSFGLDKNEKCLQELITSSSSPLDTLLYLRVPFNDKKPYLKVKESLNIGVEVRKRIERQVIVFEIEYQKVKEKITSDPVLENYQILKTFVSDPLAKKVQRSMTLIFDKDSSVLINNNFNNENRVDILLRAFDAEFSKASVGKEVKYLSSISDSDSIFVYKKP